MATAEVLVSPSSNVIGGIVAVQAVSTHSIIMSAATRVPLRDAPSAVLNSPMGGGRNNAQQAAGVKRSRAEVDASGEYVRARESASSLHHNHALATSNVSGRNGKSLQSSLVQTNAREESLTGLYKRSGAGPTALQRKLEAVRGAPTKQTFAAVPVDVQSRRAAAAAAPSTSTHEQNMENVRQWQRHYRKAFPQMRFYYDGLSKDVFQKLTAQVRSLGAVRVDVISRKNTDCE
jgi:hypothetical protein